MVKKMLGFLGGVGSVATGAALAAASFVSTLPVQAAITPINNSADVQISSVDELGTLLCNIFDYMFMILIALSAIMGIWAAYLYVTAQGEEEKLTKARRILTYVAVGVGVALIAASLPNIVGSIFKVTIGTCGTI